MLLNQSEMRIVSMNIHYIVLCEVHQRRSHLTPAFSGATNGTPMNDESCASWPPLQRIVRPLMPFIALLFLSNQTDSALMKADNLLLPDVVLLGTLSNLTLQ